MNLDRRNFFKFAAAIGASTLLAKEGLDSIEMKQYAVIDGSLLADLHTHPSRNASIEDQLDTFSKGINGITSLLGIERYVKYEDLVLLKEVEEIDKGLFARVVYKGGLGYIINTQEVEALKPSLHILALGCRKRIYDHQDPRDIVEDIHLQNGVAILNHPFVVPSGDKFRYRLLNRYEESKMRELLDMVNQVEIYNGQCIDIFFGIQQGVLGRINMQKANKKAQKLVEGTRFKGSAASDTHGELAQVRTSGILIPNNYVSLEGIKDCIINNRFERYEGKISVPSFFLGHFGYKFGR